ncbi:unnamed protein product [Diatraea saccharalis]|uniref:Uncharacterized protein n=1 Tax=Diatraea saccharalis TaxID=40085 RepID=A0A9N9RDD0_9NEOP|nr:unnamed protein product [Diatraea saccharalis]
MEMLKIYIFCFQVASSLLDVKLERTTVEQFKACLQDLRLHLEKQHSASLNHVSDFEAEREARENMACQKEFVLTDLRTAQKRIKDLTAQLEEVRRLDSGLHRRVTSQRTAASPAPASAPAPASTSASAPASNGTSRKQIYTCPKCLKFKSDNYSIMEDHFDYCLEVDNDPCSPV